MLLNWADLFQIAHVNGRLKTTFEIMTSTPDNFFAAPSDRSRPTGTTEAD